uniref:Apple domain-containing protein n=1 Tax=viral metagenome TaxID=1070528 RepID=A0A6C0EPK1_9ZZZZ
MSGIIQNNQETTSEIETRNVVLGLETLTARYDYLLRQYQQISLNYTNYLSQSQQNDRTFTSIQGKSYWGTGPIAGQSVYSDISAVNLCQAMCAENSNCSGATYKPNVNGVAQCFLRSGESETIPSGDNDYAVVPLDMFYLIQLKDLNNQLTQANNQILNIIKTRGEELYSSQVNNRFIQSNSLEENYNQLIQEREKIEALMRNFNDLNEEQNDTNISINQNYYSYIFLLLIAILCVYILIRVSSGSSENSYIQSGGKLSNQTYYIIFVLVILTLLMYYFLIKK